MSLHRVRNDAMPLSSQVQIFTMKPYETQMSSQCKKLIQAKQCFVESNSNGIQPEDACADLGRVASVPDREPRPVNEYDTEVGRIVFGDMQK